MRYSYHIFMFPFRWHIEEQRNERFGEQIAFRNIKSPAVFDGWERVIEPKTQEEKESLYNEKNYFYEFVHDALYDTGRDDNTNIVRHYERKEPKSQNVQYHIKTFSKEYVLNVDAINLNLYSTGVGVLSFYLYNEKYEDKDDILKINQFGRRVYPPFYLDKTFHNETAHCLSFEGLNGVYSEDFQHYGVDDANKPASFLRKMVNEIAPNIDIKAVIDDRMYTMSWYKNDEFVQSLCNMTDEECSNSDDWYRYVFVDAGEPTCQNTNMKAMLLTNASYKRWQKGPSLYGISRYSFVMLTSCGCPDFLLKYFETEYARMAELILVQKASVLRFSAEVTNISSMEKERQNNKLADKVRSLYKEYIRFVNQIHFREVSAQDQAIELYDKLYETTKLKEHVEKLDDEIEELHNYVSMQSGNQLNGVMAKLAVIATVFVPATFVAGVFGMNNDFMGQNSDDTTKIGGFFNSVWVQLALVVLLLIIFSIYYKRNIKGGKK